MRKKVSENIYAILIIVGIAVWGFVVYYSVSIRNNNDDKDTVECTKDSLAKEINIADSNIVKITIKYNDEKVKVIQLSDSDTVELFKQLCSE